jgi:branched-chain amino acid aminotransferase
MYRQGATIVESNCWQYAQDPLAGHKTTSYFSRLASLRAAHQHAAAEVLWFTPDGHVAEGAISNIFIVRDEQLLTPPLDTPVLPGITRATVIELAVARDIPVKETPLTRDDLHAADEIFLTNSMMEILPVVRIARQRVGEEKPGETTRELAIAYGELIDQEAEADA